MKTTESAAGAPQPARPSPPAEAPQEPGTRKGWTRVEVPNMRELLDDADVWGSLWEVILIGRIEGAIAARAAAQKLADRRARDAAQAGAR